MGLFGNSVLNCQNWLYSIVECCDYLREFTLIVCEA